MFYDNVHTPLAYDTFLAKHVLFNMLICDFVDIPLSIVCRSKSSTELMFVPCFTYTTLNKYSVSVSVSVLGFRSGPTPGCTTTEDGWRLEFRI